jgi:Flp pilus assembly pilin Flp
MLNFIKNFRNDEDGAVTVDWVVLTAAIVLLGLAVGKKIEEGAMDLAKSTKTTIQEVDD